MTDPVLTPDTPFARTVAAVRAGADLDTAVDGLLAELTDRELLWLLDGDLRLVPGLLGMARRYNATPYEAGRIDRLGLPGIRFTDGPRGVVVGASTCFPVAIARGASWDRDLERRIGAAIGAEACAQGANLFAGICINLPYAPGWGRTQETYGEDPLLLGELGAALVEGAAPWVLTCVKHFALNSMDEARFDVDVRVDEDVLHEVYLPHFRRVVEAGVDAVMSAYNAVNGTWAGEHPGLLTEVLRGRWGFVGFVMTDFVWGLRDPVASVAAGQDLEMPFRQQRARSLPAAARTGRLARPDALRAARRLVAAQVRLALRARPRPPASVVASAEHRALAREASARGTVLLRNEVVGGEPVLPLRDDGRLRVALVGRLAAAANQGDVASSAVRPPASTSVFEGLRERLGDRVVHHDGGDLAAAAASARDADVAVVVVGLTSLDEGESFTPDSDGALRLLGGPTRFGPVRRVMAAILRAVAQRMGAGGDRRDLHLHERDVRLVREVAATNERTVVIVIGGGTLMLDPWDREVGALLLAWYPGMEGGRALADVLLGAAEPAGRLPVAIPRRRDDLPVVDWQAEVVRYDANWGQRRLDREGTPAAYPLGFGLGYTSMELEVVRAEVTAEEAFRAIVGVRNHGARAGRHVVQLYATGGEGTAADVPVLVGFATVDLEPGERTDLVVDGSLRPLQRWDGRELVGPAGPVGVTAASYAGDAGGVHTVLPPAVTADG